MAKFRTMSILAAGALAGFLVPGTANAADILCKDNALNHMLVSDAYVSSCLDAGVGNINGNTSGANPDPFLTGVGTSYDHIDTATATFTQSGNTGTFSLNSSLWSSYSEIAIGFKFGTGNQPDEWFVYKLNPNVSSGTWKFVNVFQRGGGLSHTELYGIAGTTTVPEPASLSLLLLGLAGAGVAFRKRAAQ